MLFRSRVAKAEESFEFFDKTYFSEEVYSDGYSQPCVFHEFLSSLWSRSGVHVVLGPRKHGKTATMKKLFTWLMLTGRITFAATASSTLSTSKNILSDIVNLIDTERIRYDFKIDIDEDNSEQFTFHRIGRRGISRIIAISEKRSARGATLGFTRPEFILFDDLETRQSPMSSDSVEARVKIIQEASQSMSSTGSIVVLGNNFDERSAYNKLKKEQEQGVLPTNWHVYSIPAFSDFSYSFHHGNGRIPADSDIFKFPKGSLWKSRFPARSEAELREMLGAADESEWQGDFQQNPVPPDGLLFKRRTEVMYDDEALPADARGVIYVDPNLAKKQKGDFTCGLKFLYSPTTNYFYIADMVLESTTDSDVLLTKILLMKDSRVRALGMDGNVSQESSWTNNIRQYCRIHSIPFPPIEYKRYKVDELSKNAELLWSAGRILIARSLFERKVRKSDMPTADSHSSVAEVFLKQIYAFAGKKAGKKDDCPDSMICNIEFIHERNLARPKSTRRATSVITEKIF